MINIDKKLISLLLCTYSLVSWCEHKGLHTHTHTHTHILSLSFCIVDRVLCTIYVQTCRDKSNI
jgi:hypothetical protein